MALVFVALAGEWPETLDTATFYGKWRSVLGIVGPVFLPIPGLSLNLWQLLVIALLPACATAAARKFHAREMDRALLLAVVCTSLAVLWGLAKGGSLYFAYYQIWRLLLGLMLGYMLMSVLRTEQDLLLLGKIALLAGLLRAVVCIYYYWTYLRGVDDPYREYVSSHDDSMIFVLAIQLAVGWAVLTGKKWAWRFAVVFVGIILYAIVLNSRRIAWVELIFSIPLMYALIGPGPMRKKAHRLAIYIVPLLVLYIAAGMASNHAVFAPVHALSSTGSTADASSLARLEEIRNLLRTLAEAGNPLFGTGWGRPYLMVERAYNNYDEAWILAPYTPHNSLLGLAVFSGFIGFVGVWTVLPIGAFLAARAYRSESSSIIVKTASMACIGALCTFGVHCYGDIGLQSFPGAVLLGVALGVAGRLGALAAPPAPDTVPVHVRPPAQPMPRADSAGPKPFGTRQF